MGKREIVAFMLSALLLGGCATVELRVRHPVPGSVVGAGMTATASTPIGGIEAVDKATGQEIVGFYGSVNIPLLLKATFEWAMGLLHGGADAVTAVER